MTAPPGQVLIPVAFITGPLSRSLGLRAAVIIGCTLTAVGAALRIPAVLDPTLAPGRFGWVVAGHAVNAAAGPIIMSCPPLLSSMWCVAQPLMIGAIAIGGSLCLLHGLCGRAGAARPLPMVRAIMLEDNLYLMHGLWRPLRCRTSLSLDP